MHRYEELEKLYYKKKYIKYSLIGGVSIFILFLTIFLFTNNNTTPKKVVNSKQIPQKTETSTKLKKSNNTQKENNTTRKLIVKELSTPKKEINKTIIKELKKLTLYPIYPEVELNNSGVVKSNVIKNNKVTPPKQSLTTPIKTQSPSSLKIVIKSNPETITGLIDSYNHLPDFDIGLKISKLYFKQNNYTKSIEWAKKANKLNPENYETWYLFAQSLVKLGKINKAKQVLIAYINAYGPNQKIEKLLRSLK